MMHQFVVRASPGEPSTEVALALQLALRRIGPSEVYAAHVDPALAGVVLPLGAYRGERRAGGTMPILYHVSVGDRAMLAFLLERYEPIVLVHQAVPQPEPLADLDPTRAQALAFGQAQLGPLRSRVAFALADTGVAARSLQAQGYEDVRVCPLPPDLTTLRDVPSHPPTEHHFEQEVEGPLLLFFGRMAPGERLDFLVEAFHALVTYRSPKVNLAMFGREPVDSYRGVIEDLVWRLGLPRAWVGVEPEQAELATYLRRAAFFVTASEDPGLSVPALEALACGVPVVARAAGGLAETLDGGGLLLPPDSGPLLFAEGLAALLDDDAGRAALVARAKNRAAALGRDVVEASFLRQLLTVTG